MREILFKAKRIDNGEWVEGFYSQLPKPSLGATIITNGDLCAEDVSDYIIVNECKQHSNFSNAYPLEVVECEYYEIDPETLCQCTGLTDKNGKRIWENDIVLLREEIQDYEWKATVKFGNPNCEYNWGWQLVPIGECDMNKDILLWIDMEIASCEVIGNMFDNPELLERS